MLTYYDCVGLSELEEDEVEAIAQHERVPEMIAVELGCCLVGDPDGIKQIEQIIREDMEDAYLRGYPQEAAHWKTVLDNFNISHAYLQAAA